ncbi:MAG: thioredoxin family protein [Candidatus Korobacteraceae bacterium]
MKNETPAVPKPVPQRRVPRDWVLSTSSDTFSKLVLEGKGPIAVEFMSYGCAHCQAIEPVLQQVAAMVKSIEKVFRVNIAVEPELAERYEIQGTPTLIMFLDGTEVGRVEGPSPVVSTLLTAIKQPYES